MDIEQLTELQAIGKRLREVRKDLELSQRALARWLGITHSTYSSWELGKTGPSAAALMKLCLHGYSGHWLLTGTGPKQSEEPEGSQISPTQEQTQPVDPALEEAPPDDRAAQALAKLKAATKEGLSSKVWSVMNALLKVYPSSASLDHLMMTCEQEKPELLSNLLYLKRSGSVEEISVDAYRLSGDTTSERLLTNRVQERFDLAYQAANAIVNDVLPAMAKSQGRITLMRGRFQSGVGASLLEDLGRSVISKVEEAGALPGETEGVTVLLAVAVDADSE